jgi:hypothetical protein
MLFQNLGPRKVVADFSGGYLSNDGGVLLLQQVDSGLEISRTLAACFKDDRDSSRLEHSVEELVRQRIFALSLGYEDLNDHAQLRRDPLLATVIGKEDPLGTGRRLEKDRGSACASPATLNRLELGAKFSDRYRKIQADPQQVEAAVLELGVRCLPRDQELFVLDFDATDDPLHGRQEGRFFHGYYDSYCYLPLFCFVGDVPVWAQLRTSDTDASAGTCEALEKMVPAIRKRFPKAKGGASSFPWCWLLDPARVDPPVVRALGRYAHATCVLSQRRSSDQLLLHLALRLQPRQRRCNTHCRRAPPQDSQ